MQKLYWQRRNEQNWNLLGINDGMNFSDHHLTDGSSKRRNECSASLELALEVSHWYWLGRKDVHCAITKGLTNKKVPS
jgi:hypothetical protein